MCQMGLEKREEIHLCDLQNKMKNFNHIDSISFENNNQRETFFDFSFSSGGWFTMVEIGGNS